MAMMTIGQLARATGCKVPTIRYYEQIGLLSEPARTAGNQRRYGPAHAARLGFVRHCRDLGFSQAVIRELLELTAHPEQPCVAVTELARGHLDDIDRRISRLRALRCELARMIDQCQGNQVADCHIIEALAGQRPANGNH